MGRYLFIGFVGLLAVVVIVLVMRWLDVWTDDMAKVTDESKPEVVLNKVADPEVVAITLGDSLYHQPECSWIGSGAKRTSRKNAIEMGFHPCPYCIAE
jgi:hypothetical protein